MLSTICISGDCGEVHLACPNWAVSPLGTLWVASTGLERKMGGGRGDCHLWGDGKIDACTHIRARRGQAPPLVANFCSPLSILGLGAEAARP